MTRFVRSGAVVGALLALLVVAVGVRAAAGPGAGSFDPASHRFTLAVIPDTQYLLDDDRGDSEPVTAALEWMVNNRGSQNIAFAAGLGDVTQDGLQNEVDRADDAYKILDRAQLPYTLPTGNHDINSNTSDTRGESAYSRAFNRARYERMSTFVDASANAYNIAQIFTAGGRQWMVLALDWRVSNEGIAWAQGVLDAHKTVPTILTSHDMLSANAAGQASLTGNGQQIWDRLIKSNDQIFLTLSGHNWPVGRVTRTNDFGHPVEMNLADYQDMYYGGAGIIRTYAFDLDRNTIDVSTFSPWVQNQPEGDRSPLEREMLEKTDAPSRFSIPVDFDALAQRLDPKPAPADVADDALKLPGTVALWRPSGEGAVTRIEDASGNGNDLTPVTLNGSTGDQAQVGVNADHAADQPSAKSLKFTSNKSQHRGTYLQTADGAPLNTKEFRDGYTIEAFIKLPPNCCNSNAWMGLLGQHGTGRDLGRTQGDPDEGSVELALSGGAELQWAIWPTNRPDNTTAWGHLFRSDEWIHVAVVNDGRYTDLYANGSLLGRNPLSPAIGIGTTGRPWTLGAINYGGTVEQTFNGLVGDVRIVDHALPPSRFMNAARTPRLGVEATRATLNGKAIDVAFDAPLTGSVRVAAIERHTGKRFALGTQAVTGATGASFALTDVQYAALGDGAPVEVTLDENERVTLHLRAEGKPFQPTLEVPASAPAGGEVPATLNLTLGAPASFGAFTPGVARTYSASTTASVISTAGDATLTVADASGDHQGHLVNGSFALGEPLQGLGTIKRYAAPVANDDVDVTLTQSIGADEALRTGSYSKTLTFTLSTATP